MTLEASIGVALSTVMDPELRRPITEVGMVENIIVQDDGTVTVDVLLTIAGCPLKGTITRDVEKALAAVDGVHSVIVRLSVMSQQQRDKLKEKLRGPQTAPGIPFNDERSLTRIYAVASGKGGVGKSSVTVNLAAAMAAEGLRVGIIGTDVYGFSWALSARILPLEASTHSSILGRNASVTRPR